MTEVAGPQPGEESCGCDPVGVFGIVPADDPRYLGGCVDASGLRHDPLRHRDGCPALPAQQPVEETEDG